MSYLHRPAEESFDSRTIMQLFDVHAERHPDRQAFVLYDDSGQRCSTTFQQMQQQSLHLAASFLRLGWKRGQRIIMWLSDGIEFLVCYMALLRIGVNVILEEEKMSVEWIIAKVKEIKTSGMIIGETEGLDTFSKTIIKECKIVRVCKTDGANVDKAYSYYNDLLESGATLDLKEVLNQQRQVQFDDPAVVFYTSGSTGEPKGAQHTIHEVVNRTIISAVHDSGVSQEENGVEYRVFNDRPFTWSASHFFGINPVLLLGCTLIYIPPKITVKLRDTEHLLKVLQDEKCTNALLMPYALVDIINHPQVSNYDLRSLKVIMTGGQPVRKHLLRASGLILPNTKLCNGYGSTEYFQIATLKYDMGENEQVGMEPLPGNEVKIINTNNCIVPVGEAGEICIRSTLSFLGYLENSGATSQATTPTGWFHTGDLGYITRDGKLVICGRLADFIKRAVEKIAPATIENVLIEYPDVKDIVVVGVPDVRLGEELCACVIAKDGSALKSRGTEFEEWMTRQWQEDIIGLTYKPKYLLVMKEFPKKRTGKTDRKVLRAMAAQELGIELE